MNFDDQDWEQLGHPAQGEYRDTSTPWKVAAGVAAGMVLGALLMAVLDRAPETASAPVAAAYVPAAEPTRAGAPAAAAVAVVVPPASSSAATAATADDGSASRPAVAKAREVEAVQRAAWQAAERRDRDWARFYQKPAQCDDNPSKATMVECANHYIRARRQFEDLYGPAKR